jgi:diguanylate cyclase (GGDEF)-like protein
MTSRGRSGRAVGGFAALLFIGLPIPLPPLPTLPAAIPSPPSIPSIVPAPPTPPVLPSTGVSSPIASAPPVRAAQPQPAQSAPTARSTNPPARVTIPFTTIALDSPLDVALLAALATLPLLFGIWLLLFGRTFAEARRARDAQVRLTLAADLGLRPRELASMGTKALFELREKSAFDELTGVLRRAAGISAAEREIARARRHSTPLAIAFVDIDGLREENDSRGHGAGDGLLRTLAEALRDGLRAEDVLIRYGGDEFVCVLPETSERDARTKLGEIQVAAAKSAVRFAFGVAQLERSDDVVSLFARADRDLYDFKSNRGEIVQLPTARDSESLTSASN